MRLSWLIRPKPPADERGSGTRQGVKDVDVQHLFDMVIFPWVLAKTSTRGPTLRLGTTEMFAITYLCTDTVILLDEDVLLDFFYFGTEQTQHRRGV